MKFRLSVRYAIAGGLVCTLQPTPPAQAAWPHDPYAGNVALCTASGSQYSVRGVQNGIGGSIFAWSDFRNGNFDVYAQRVDVGGSPRWAADGVALTHGAGTQWLYGIAPDGGGGAIVVWVGEPLSATDVYAQRVNANGSTEWPGDGVAICTTSGHQTMAVIASDGAGGAIIAWRDHRGTSYDIYAQQVDATGAIRWPANGVAVCVDAGDQWDPILAPDGSGGAIVTWSDFRNGNYDVYVQRVSASGDPQWTANGVSLCLATNDQRLPACVSDGAGGAIVTWLDTRAASNGDVYAQRVSAVGSSLWAPDGVAICTASSQQHTATIASDGAGGAIIAWCDERPGADIYAQRVDATGAVRWTIDGVSLCTAARNQFDPAIASDGEHGAIVAWVDQRDGFSAGDIWAQRVDPFGAALWLADGVALCTATAHQSYPAIMSDGDGGTVVAWTDERSGNEDIYAQRLERFGYLGPEPTIVSVRDVPNDQGGRVKVSWQASWLDAASDSNLTAYDVYRSAPGSVARAASRRDSHVDAWEYLTTVPVTHFLDVYGYVAPTTGDSIAASNPLTAYMVVGRNVDGTRFWLSPPDSGYSVDNLPPAAPASFRGQYVAGTSTLRWAPNVELDLAVYRLHRGSTADFVPAPENLIAEQPDTSYVDVAGAPCYYKLAALDVHENVSEYAVLLPDGAVGAGGVSAAASLSLGSENPSRSGAWLRWSVAREGEARLAVYDVTGRLVRELARGRFGSGEQVTYWNGHDASGRAVGGGLYLARLQTSERRLSVRMMVLR